MIFKFRIYSNRNLNENYSQSIDRTSQMILKTLLFACLIKISMAVNISYWFYETPDYRSHENYSLSGNLSNSQIIIQSTLPN